MGWFITFEGIEGCGKSTQVRLLTAHLRAIGRRVTATREPGGCPISDQIRGILLDADNRAMSPLTELLLYAAARSQHVGEIIAPALARNEVVICDRFTDATVAYQGFGRRLEMPVIAELNRLATRGILPDLTVLLDCPVETGLRRAMSRIEATAGAREERFELEAVEFHRRVQAGYRQLAAEDPGRFVIIDAGGGIDATAAAVTAAVTARLPAE